MRLQERRPSLTRRRLRSQPTQVFLDAAFGDLDPDFEQLAADRFCALEQIVCCHAPDQIDCGLWQARTRLPCLGLPPPKQSKAFAMPAQQRVWLDDQKRLSPVAQPAGAQNNSPTRSPFVNWGRLIWRCKIPSWCRSKAFSAMSSARVRVTSTSVASTGDARDGWRYPNSHFSSRLISDRTR